MSTFDREEPDDRREVLLGGEDAAAESPFQQLALAWAVLAGSVAPAEAVTADRVLVVRPVSVHGGNEQLSAVNHPAA